MIEGVEGVLLDFAGTLFDQEPETDSLRAIGLSEAEIEQVLPSYRHNYTVEAHGGRLPPHLLDLWHRRDLTADEHRRAYVGLSLHEGVPDAIAGPAYERMISAESWYPYDDTAEVLGRLRDAGVPVAVISNIAWDLRDAFRRHRLDGLVDAFVLSYEHGVMKPDPQLFEIACAEIGVSPGRAVMVGDTVTSDGGSTAAGIQFVHIGSPRADQALLRALHL